MAPSKLLPMAVLDAVAVRRTYGDNKAASESMRDRMQMHFIMSLFCAHIGRTRLKTFSVHDEA